MSTSQQTSANFLGLPDILPDIYRSSSVLDAVKKHIETLEKSIAKDPGNMNTMLLKNAFQQYHYYISKEADKNRQAFNLIHQNTVKNHPTLNIKTTSRIKSLLSFYDKCRSRLFSGLLLDDITDVYACRIIIDDAHIDQEELIKLCYNIMDETISFMISQGYMPCGSSMVKDTENFNPEVFPNIYIPKQSYLNPENERLVKDYIRSPKKDNAYQSLHAEFAHTSGRRFELQVRTCSMDHQAEYGPAAHTIYKKMQRQKNSVPTLNLDRKKVRMSFYNYTHNELTDNAGLEKSLFCLVRTYIPE